MKYVRSYPHTNDWKDRTYQPEFVKINTVIGLIVVIALFLSINHLY